MKKVKKRLYIIILAATLSLSQSMIDNAPAALLPGPAESAPEPAPVRPAASLPRLRAGT